MQQAELAAELGIHPSVVTRLKARGMPVDSIEAARQWRLVNVRARISAQPPAAAPPNQAPPPADRAGIPLLDVEPGDYWASRARREQAEANLAELKLAEQRGQLVRAADIRTAYAKRAAGLREGLLQLPARLSAVLASESDQSKVHDILQAELHGVLAALADA